MFNTDDGVFLRFSGGSDKRILHAAKIVRVDDDLFTACFAEADILPKAGQEATLFFESKNNVFMQQAVRIDAVMQGEKKPTIGFVRIGEAVSAEARQSYRVSTALAGLTAKIGREKDCQTLDVSYTGFSAIVNFRPSPGTTVPVMLEYEGQKFHGSAVVQSVEPRPSGGYRVGLHHAAAGAAGVSMKKGLQMITADLQRKQLRRRAGVSA